MTDTTVTTPLDHLKNSSDNRSFGVSLVFRNMVTSIPRTSWESPEARKQGI